MKHSTPSNDDPEMDSSLTSESGGEIPAGSRKSARKRKRASDTSHSDLADASIGQMLSGLLDRIFVTRDLSELNTIATILQRLLVSSQQVLTLRSQLDDSVGMAGRAREGLDMPIVRQLERQLRLL
ncbi:MAG: hypothetical protein LBF26_02205 [Puniceicoccales bacterium]|jgi:hypothetical protein|nr:hypothetical protein [Puniceicoccales bacterium]